MEPEPRQNIGPALILGLLKAVILSGCVMAPGFALLITGHQVSGMLAMMAGSCCLLLLGFHKAWRLTVWSCLIPAVTSGLCLLIQFFLVGTERFPNFILIMMAMMAGFGIGIWRGKAHRVFQQNGHWMASRSLGFLLVWMFSLLMTQTLAAWGNSLALVHTGFLTGTFSTSVLIAAGSILLIRKSRLLAEHKHQVVAALVAAVVFLLPTTSNAQVEGRYSVTMKIGSGKPSDFPGTIYFKEAGGEVAHIKWEMSPQFHQQAEGFAPAIRLLETPGSGKKGGGHYIFRDQSAEGVSQMMLMIGAAAGAVTAAIFSDDGVALPGFRQDKQNIYYSVLVRDQNRLEIRCPIRGEIDGQAIAFDVEFVATRQGPLNQSDAQLGWRPPQTTATQTRPPPVKSETSRPIETPAVRTMPDAPESTFDRSPTASSAAISGSGLFEPEYLIATGILASGLIAAAGAGMQILRAADDRLIADSISESIEGGAFSEQEHPVALEDQSENLRRQAESLRNSDSSSDWFDDWDKKEAADLEERANEISQHASNMQAIEDLARTEEIAYRRGEYDLVDRLGDDRIYKENGELDIDYIQRAKEILRKRISREQAAPDEELEKGWVGELISQTGGDIMNDWKTRLLASGLSGGTSEVAFQSWNAGKRMKEAAEKAEDEGRELDVVDGLREGFASLAEENLPVETARTLGEMRTSWRKGETGPGMWDLAVAVGSDVMTTFGLKDDAKNVIGGVKLRNVRYKADGVAIDEVLHRVTPEEAARQAKTGQVSANTQSLLKDVEKNADPKLKKLDEAFSAGREAGWEKVQNLDRAARNLDRLEASGSALPEELTAARKQLREETLRVQADKHAMNRMNDLRDFDEPQKLNEPGKLQRDSKGGNRTIERFNGELNEIYHETDIRVRAAIAEAYGVPIEDVATVKITNVGGADMVVDPAKPQRVNSGLASSVAENGKFISENGEIGKINRPPTAEQTTAFLAQKDAEGGLLGQARKLSGGTDKAKTTKASFDRDLTMRVQLDGVWKDVPSSVTGKIYNEELFKVAKGTEELQIRSAGEGFVNVHPTHENVLRDVMEVEHPDQFASILDQATTDRLNAEAYGTGQPDLETSTMGPKRGRDLIDVEGTAHTMSFKQDHWLNQAERFENVHDTLLSEAEQLREAARAVEKNAPDEAKSLFQNANEIDQKASKILQNSVAYQEEGMRQLVKQTDNMLTTRTLKMIESGNAPGASIPLDLIEKVNVLRKVQRGEISAPMAEATLRKMGTSTRQVSSQLSALVEGTQTLRSPGHVAVEDLYGTGKTKASDFRGFPGPETDEDPNS